MSSDYHSIGVAAITTTQLWLGLKAEPLFFEDSHVDFFRAAH